MRGWWLAFGLVLLTRVALAGANADGTLILHANPSIAYSEGTGYCGESGLQKCSSADDSVDVNGTHVVHVIAAFPKGASPRLRGITFGLSYPERIVIVAHGKCGDFELASTDWPSSESGTSVTWDTTQTTLLTEVYWFAAYVNNSTPGTLALVGAPDLGANFGDDSTPAVLDPITELGTMGFGEAGHLPCPDAGGTGGTLKVIHE
jgi:hypothetical protein